MVCVGIDVAKDKHDCCILDSDGTVSCWLLHHPEQLRWFQKAAANDSRLYQKVGLEATGHYSYNILGFPLSTVLRSMLFSANIPVRSRFPKVILPNWQTFLQQHLRGVTEKTKLSRFEMQPELPLDPLCLLNLWNWSIPLNSFGKLPPRLMKSKFLFSFEIACGF